ncbi:MAG: DNA cytosine methyltransferase [Rhizobiales bacterium]|nr:DNA cytosine methyltransferase [Hyphomicrobiales bacterium]
MTASYIDVDIKHFHLFCGLGGGARGFNRGQARVGSLRAKFRCIGGIDSDPASIRDFSRRAGAPGTVMDLFSREQYCAFHGKEPPAGWREASPLDVFLAAAGEFPNIVFLSAPCKGFSGLLPEKSSITDKYQALNALTLRGVWLMLEAFKDDPPELIIFENVPRIAKRGRGLLDQIVALLRSYGYAVAETTHDCGEIGGLGQSRKRFLLVARHQKKVPPFLYEPERRRLRGVGEILEALPLPGDLAAGPMHRMPSLQWKTWVRLAFVEAGSDWRSLNKLAVENGHLRDFGILPDAQWHGGVLGVVGWSETAGVVAGRSSPTNGSFSVADPRFPANGNEYSQYGVREWADTMGAVINVKSPGQGSFSVADPRIEGKPRFNNVFRIVPWVGASPAVAGPGGPAGGLAVADPRPSDLADKAHVKYRVTAYGEAAGTVIAASTTGNGAFAVADPRTGGEEASRYKHSYRVTEWGGSAGTVTSGHSPSNGAICVADPRPVGLNAKRDHYQTGGHYGVVTWDDTSRAVPGFAKYDRGPFAVADPRDVEPQPIEALPKPEDRLVAVIRALDGTWHRPFTTLELAALQSLVDPDELAPDFSLDGASDAAWRERIGNAVPPAAAEAIAGVMGTTILLARAGETFVLSSQPIWVRPLAAALAIDHSPNDVLLQGEY